MSPTEITPTEALEWLAGLEHPDGRPVLDLREPCPCINLVEAATRADGINHHYDSGGCRTCYVRNLHTSSCTSCHGTNWVPKQGRQAVQDAMLKAGWEMVLKASPDGLRNIRFSPNYSKATPQLLTRPWRDDDHIAAMRAMKAAGYE